MLCNKHDCLGRSGKQSRQGYIDRYSTQYMYMYNCDIFSLRPHLFVLAPLSQTLGGVGTIPPSGSRCRRFERDPLNSVSLVASLLHFFGLGHT